MFQKSKAMGLLQFEEALGAALRSGPGTTCSPYAATAVQVLRRASISSGTLSHQEPSPVPWHLGTEPLPGLQKCATIEKGEIEIWKFGSEPVGRRCKVPGPYSVANPTGACA